MRESFLFYFGATILFLIVLGLAALAIGYLIDTFNKVHEIYWYKAKEAGAKEFAERLNREAHWFSEDPAVMALVRKIGEKATLGWEWNIDQLRDCWREAKKETLTKAGDADE